MRDPEGASYGMPGWRRKLFREARLSNVERRVKGWVKAARKNPGGRAKRATEWRRPLEECRCRWLGCGVAAAGVSRVVCAEHFGVLPKWLRNAVAGFARDYAGKDVDGLPKEEWLLAFRRRMKLGRMIDVASRKAAAKED